MAEKQKKKASWTKIKAEYIAGEKSCRTLALEHEVSESAIFRRSSKEGWSQLREEYRSKVTAEAIACAHAREVKDMSEVLGVAKTLLGEIQLALGDPKQLYRYIVTDGDGNPVEREFTKLDAKSIKELASALKELVPIMATLEKREPEKTEITAEDIAQRLNSIANDKNEKSSDRLRANELLGKFVGMFTDKLRVDGKFESGMDSLEDILKQLEGNA